MKHIKTFENVEDFGSFKVGDYVIMSSKGMFLPGFTKGQHKTIDDFLLNNIGIIININKAHPNIKVEYHNIPSVIDMVFASDRYGRHYSYIFHLNSVEEYAPTIEELKMKLATKIYNL